MFHIILSKFTLLVYLLFFTDNSDFNLTSPTQLTFPPNRATIFSVSFTFLQDNLTQELNETLILSLVATGLPPPSSVGAVFIDNILLVIEDADGKL